MKQIIFFLAFFISSLNIMAQTSANSITVNISNINKIKGTLIIGLYDSESSFMKKRTAGKLEKVTAKTATVIFTDIKSGEYAISLFHDANDNEKLDTFLFGIPKEDYGCSNNARGKMGPPKWSDAVFTVNNENIIQNIKL